MAPKRKMVLPNGGVETPAKIAMSAPSEDRMAVDLLLPPASVRREFFYRKFAAERYLGVTPKVLAKRSL